MKLNLHSKEPDIPVPLYAILVAYNHSLEKSPSYQALNKHKDIQLIVCDNSTNGVDIRSNVVEDGNIYISMHGNRGLSKAYNRALDQIQVEDPTLEGYVMLFDDDTKISNQYFEEVKKAIQTKEADIYLPLVTDGHPEQGYLSPSILREPYVHRTKTPWLLKEQEICGINSGMLISLSLFKEYRYNEELFLDHVDHDFIRSMRKQKAIIKILNAELNQDLSSFQTDGTKAISRYDILKRDLNIFYKEGWKNRLYYYYVLFRRKGSIFMQTKDWRIWLH